MYRIRSIVEKLLQYSRTENGLAPSEMVDVNELLDTTLRLVDHELSAKSISINKKMCAIEEVNINPQELQQVLVNLLMNAIQALPDGGVIEYSTRDTSDGIEIIVKDYGAGISAGDLPHVFDPFFSRKPTGTGLGLSVSFGLIQRYGGTGNIRVNSEAGAWTEFTVVLRKKPVIEDSGKVSKS